VFLSTVRNRHLLTQEAYSLAMRICIHVLTDQIKHLALAGLEFIIFYRSVKQLAGFQSHFCHQQYPSVLSVFAFLFCSFFSYIFIKGFISFETTGMFEFLFSLIECPLKQWLLGQRQQNIQPVLRHTGTESEGLVFDSTGRIGFSPA